MRSESQFQKECIDYLKTKGCYVYKNNQNEFTEKGRPDLTVCMPVVFINKGRECKVGLYMGLELKREDKYNKTSLAQEIVGRQIRKAHGLWYKIDSIEQLDTIIRSYME